MDTFNYQRLELKSSAFRLVRLLKGVANDFIRCELVYTTLDENVIPYEAVSYTWGSSDKPLSIFLQGQKFMVTENLWGLLKDLRKAESDRYLWIDAIAINQGDDLERGHQVQRMQAIYGGAERVLIYLGRDSPFTRILMESLLLFQTSISGRYAGPDNERWGTTWQIVLSKLQDKYNSVDLKGDLRKGLNELLQRPWFRRVWVLQEVANARTASVFCGENSIRAPIFVMAPILLGLDLNSHAAAVFELMPTYPGNGSRKTRDKKLLPLLLDFRHSEASDPRDKIFALLGLCEDSGIQKYIEPDYTQTEFNVLYTTIAYFMSKTTEPARLRLGRLLAEAKCLMKPQEMPVSDTKPAPSNWRSKVSELLEEAIQLLRILNDPPSPVGILKEKLNEDLRYLVKLVSRSSEENYQISIGKLASMRCHTRVIISHSPGDQQFPSSINQFLSDLANRQPDYMTGFIYDMLSSWDTKDLCSFLQRREVEIDITLEMAKAAATNKFNAVETVSVLLRHGRLGESSFAKMRDKEHAWGDLSIYSSDMPQTVPRLWAEVSPGEVVVTVRRENLYLLVFLESKSILGKLIYQLEGEDTATSDLLQRLQHVVYQESHNDPQRDVQNCGREDLNFPLPSVVSHPPTVNRQAMVQVLLEDLNNTVGNIQTWSLLLIAVLSGETDIVQLLLEKYPEEFNLPCESANVAFRVAMDCRHRPIVQCLLDNGVKLTLGAAAGNQQRQHRCEQPSSPQTDTFSPPPSPSPPSTLRKLDETISKRLHDPLSLALDRDDHDLVALFLPYRTSIVPSNPEMTPLHVAALYAHTRLAKFLLKQGADPNATDSCGRTALDIAKGVWRNARNLDSDDWQSNFINQREAEECFSYLVRVTNNNRVHRSEESNGKRIELVKQTPQKRQAEMKSEQESKVEPPSKKARYDSEPGSSSFSSHLVQ
ncbi:hypothetical protein RRF57_004846 [Xylaria bambusicola]|uniref:Heterokaryon incompatibility domain-containing protein n=1 Tax=Xylaria bambusicola TaxID=326684 RepID=A0AAN7UMH7_9PEZI